MRSTNSRAVRIAAASMAFTVLGLAVTETASARAIRIDSALGSFESSGQAWSETSPDGEYFIRYQTSTAATWFLPFEVSIGGASYDSLCASEFGVVWFGATTCDSPASLAELGSSPYISPAFDPSFALDPAIGSADLRSINVPGAMTYSIGWINPSAKPYGGSYCDPESGSSAKCIETEKELGRLYRAARINWAYTIDGVDSQFQVVFLSLAGKNGNEVGAFEVEVGHFPAFEGRTGSISLGDTSQTLTPRPGENYVFSFGTTVTPPPTGVPEPGTLALLAAGLLGLAAAARRRSDRKPLTA